MTRPTEPQRGTGDAISVSRDLGSVAAVLVTAGLLVGIALRIFGIGDQIVGGDEIHTVAVATQNDLAYVLTRFHVADNCIPITAWTRTMLVAFGLEEWGMRLPSIVAGIFLLVVVTRSSRGLYTAGGRAVLVFLFATSPLLVHWSREARPYAVVTALGVLALASISRAALGGRKLWYFVAAGSVAGLLYFSLTALPFAFALTVAAGLASLPRRSLRHTLWVLVPGALGLALAALALAPAIPSLLDVLNAKEGFHDQVRLETLVHSARMIIGLPATGKGDPWTWTVLLPTALIAFGMIRFARRYRRLAFPMIGLLAIPPVAYMILQVRLLETPRVFVRYQAACVPIYLALLAYGWDGLAIAIAKRRPSRVAAIHVAGSILIGVAVFAPLTTALPPGNPYGPITSRLYRTEPLEARSKPERFPAFYRERHAEEPGVICEWPATSELRSLYAMYQRYVGHRLVRIDPRFDPETTRIRFRTLRLSMSDLFRRTPPGAWIVLHRKPREERAHIKSARSGGKKDARRFDLEKVLGRCRDRFGDPVYEDDWIVAFRAE